MPAPIAFTVGEPAGVGPDLAIAAVHALQQQPATHPVVLITDYVALQARARRLNLPLSLPPYSALPDTQPPSFSVLHMPFATEPVPGRLDPLNVQPLLNTIIRATKGVLAQEFSALVTGPVHKGIINDAGIPFTGHTQYLAYLTQAMHPVMMLQNPSLRVALATQHIPLSRVAETLTPSLLLSTLRVLHHDLVQRFGISAPRIGVLGLNPHAGEGGHLGQEEITILRPVITQLQREGFNIEGPIPPDTAFIPAWRAKMDAFLALYHDQGLPTVKALDFEQTVNVTLGLPIIRTSVDHGTALELAGSGEASVGSLKAALQLAMQLAS